MPLRAGDHRLAERRHLDRLHGRRQRSLQRLGRRVWRSAIERDGQRLSAPVGAGIDRPNHRRSARLERRHAAVRRSDIGCDESKMNANKCKGDWTMIEQEKFHTLMTNIVHDCIKDEIEIYDIDAGNLIKDLYAGVDIREQDAAGPAEFGFAPETGIEVLKFIGVLW